MEKYLDNFLAKLTFLDLQTDQKIAEFSSRVGWSIAVLFLVHETFGDAYVMWGAFVWLFYAMLRETRVEGGVLPMIFVLEDKTEPFKGLITNLISSCAAPLIFILLRMVFR